MMSSKTLKHLRIVVHINEQDSEDQNGRLQNIGFECGVKAGIKRNIKGEEVVPSSPPKNLIQGSGDSLEFDNMKAEVLVIDDKSLQLNLISTEDCGPYTNISHKMYFDHVAHSSTDVIKSELAIVMDNLLLKRKNSCIVRFTTKQEMDINIYFDVLIAFLDKRIYHQKYKLQYVKLECVGIASSMQNSKNPTEKSFATCANLAGSTSVDCNNNEAIFRLSRNDKRQFRSTRDLLLWILNEYNFKFSDNKGHEKLQFSFSIVDHQQNLFKVKLSLFNIFLNFMNTQDRNHWHHYMDHMGEGCKGLDCKFVHSGLTISLSNYIEGIGNANTLLFFDVPTNIQMTATTIEMLQMAHGVIKNRKKKLLLLSNNVNLNRRLPTFSNDCTECLSPQRWEKLMNEVATNPKKVCLSPFPLLVKRQSIGMSLYDGKDFNALSGWYRKIDECFEKNCQLREKYFSHYFKLKTNQISSNIQNMFKSLESLGIEQNERDLNELQENQIELHKLFKGYQEVRSQFQQLSEGTKGTAFEEILNIYLETKTFDLNNQAVASKRKYLQLCKQHLSFTFDHLTGGILMEFEI